MNALDTTRANERLRQERIRRNWRQREVADQIGATVVTIRRWEQGSQQPSAYFRIKLCALFEKSAEDLGFFPDPPPPSTHAEMEGSTVARTPSLSASFLDKAQMQPDDVTDATSLFAAVASPLPQPPPAAHAVAGHQQNRARLLRRLRCAYRDLLEHSLEGEVWLELGLTWLPNAVQNATRQLLCPVQRANRVLSPGTSLLTVYEGAAEELLVLGEPGAGKSTLLLNLAQQLVQRAEEANEQPLPVIVPLSSWAEKRLPLDAWLAQQICQIYDIPRKLCERWIREQQFVPLLDGLDEMEETARSACVAAINMYHREHLGPLVVSSRTTEYQAATTQSQLTLQGAVMVQPLSLEQVESALPQTFYAHSALWKETTTPLLLHLLLLMHCDATNWESDQKESRPLQHIWTVYVQRMIERKGSAKQYPLPRTRSWLSWLARQMRKRNQTVFYLEHLQPDWLTAGEQRFYNWIAMRLPAIVIGMLISILIMSLPSLSGFIQESVLGGLLGGLWCEALHQRSISHSQKKVHLLRWGIRLAISALIGLIFGLSFGFDYSHSIIGNWMSDGLFFGAMIGLGSFLLQSLFVLEPRRRISPGSRPMHRWQRPVRFLQTTLVMRALLTAVIYGLIHGLLYGLGQGQNYVLGYRLDHGLVYGLDCGLNYGLNYGLVSLVAGLAVRLITTDVRLPERLRWTGESLKRSLVAAKHLRMTGFLISCFLLLGLSIGLIYGPLYGLIFGLIFGLGIGLSYWFLFGLFQGIAYERIEDRDRRVPNQGIRRALSNSVSMGIISGGMLGIIGFLGYGIAVGLNTELNAGLNSSLQAGLNTGPGMGLLIGVTGGCLVWLLMGGVAVLRHAAIRCLLWRSQTFPRRAVSFLDDATARILLRRVGGGYSFTHRLLLEYFADLNADRVLSSDIKKQTSQEPQ